MENIQRTPGKIEPRLLKGFKDYLPAEAIARAGIIATIREIYELYGFSPLETPAMEYKETLAGYGDQASKQIYCFTDPDGAEVGLRYDLTVSLARLIAMDKNLPRPFKRYQVAPVWRADKPDPGRFREFIQFDIDTVGSGSMLADVELIAALCDALEALGIPRFVVRVNNRKLLNALMAFAGIDSSKIHQVFRVLDKLERQGMKAVRQELTLGRTDESGDKIPGLGLAPSSVDRIEQFLLISHETRLEALDAVAELFKDIPEAAEAIAELREIDRHLTNLRRDEHQVRFDFAIARGLDYYTGPVFETTLLDLPEYGSIASGGRYDRLVERFTEETICATGVSIGIDRLFAALVKLGKVDPLRTTTDVLVTVMDHELMDDYQKIVESLRAARIGASLYLGNEKSLGKQLRYCDKSGIPIAIIMGSDEKARGEVTIKNMLVLQQAEKIADRNDRQEWLKTRMGQQSVPFDSFVQEIRKMITEREGTPL